jgi:hypothetical protein
MPITQKYHAKGPSFMEVNAYKFEVVCSIEVHKRIMAANRCFYGLRRHLRSQLIPRSTKILMYKMLVRPVLLYASETWPLLSSDERFLNIFERRILQLLFGPVEENGVWSRRYNKEIYELFKEPDVVQTIKIKRLEWAGHLLHMDYSRTVKKILNATPDGTRKVERPRQRLEESVRQDIRILGIRNWRNSALNREEWRKHLRRPGHTSGC